MQRQCHELRLTLVPGLLQTAEYARAVLATRPNTSQDKIGDLVAARLARQDVLARENPPLLWVLIDEGVLYREVGTAEVMRAWRTSSQPGRLAHVGRPGKGRRSLEALGGLPE